MGFDPKTHLHCLHWKHFSWYHFVIISVCKCEWGSVGGIHKDWALREWTVTQSLLGIPVLYHGAFNFILKKCIFSKETETSPSVWTVPKMCLTRGLLWKEDVSSQVNCFNSQLLEITLENSEKTYCGPQSTFPASQILKPWIWEGDKNLWVETLYLTLAMYPTCYNLTPAWKYLCAFLISFYLGISRRKGPGGRHCHGTNLKPSAA